MNNFINLILLILGYATQFSNISKEQEKPNIILIVADDLGWNDVGFHGSSQIPTPNIDTMAYSGIILNNYYVNPICTPSRSALLTGKYPIHTGMQHGVLDGAEPRGLPLTEKLLPEYLKDEGYVNHIVGKWHLGSFKKRYTPTFRGFDSHLGFWIGHQDYFDHTSESHGCWGLDMRRNMDLAKNLHGKYSTDVFSKEAVNIILNHDQKSPLFLYVAHAAVHSGNSYNPLPAPDSYVENFSYIKNYSRQRFAGMLSKLDESFGDIIQALSKKKMLENSIVIFTTDNGGPAEGFNQNAASNYPLRGVKDTLWEGGIRGSAFVWSVKLKHSKRVSNQMMHISDWLPTILEAISANISESSNQTKFDGVSLWKSLSKNMQSPRDEILHNIDDIIGISALTYKSWKYIKASAPRKSKEAVRKVGEFLGESYSGKWSNWYGPSGRNYSYNYTLLENSKVFKSLNTLNENANRETMIKMRKDATVNCSHQEFNKCEPEKNPCLFRIDSDPCEKFNMADRYPDLMLILETKLQNYNKTALPPGNLPRDPRGYPENWDYAWVNFGDLI